MLYFRDARLMEILLIKGECVSDARTSYLKGTVMSCVCCFLPIFPDPQGHITFPDGNQISFYPY